MAARRARARAGRTFTVVWAIGTAVAWIWAARVWGPAPVAVAFVGTLLVIAVGKVRHRGRRRTR